MAEGWGDADPHGPVSKGITRAHTFTHCYHFLSCHHPWILFPSEFCGVISAPSRVSLLGLLFRFRLFCLSIFQFIYFHTFPYRFLSKLCFSCVLLSFLSPHFQRIQHCFLGLNSHTLLVSLFLLSTNFLQTLIYHAHVFLLLVFAS